MVHRVAPDAARDLDDIWFYTAKESGSVELADKAVDAIIHRFYLLARHPHIGRTRDDLRPGLRGFAVGVHVIFYRADGNDVVILRVLHGRLDTTGMMRAGQ